MADIKWIDRGVSTTPPKKPKKLTGTRFASVLGLNRWSTPFEIWCAVSRVWEKPFEDSIYTIAGKTIEPKQAEFMRNNYFMTNIVTPTDIYGADYFSKTFGDFFPKEKIFGGMWDYLLMGADGKPTTVLEMKTTKRAEDWADDIPEYYALQAALYAYLLGVEDVVMVCTILDPSDYEHPDEFVCSTSNTMVRPFKLHQRYPNFEDEYVSAAEAWWKAYVDTGFSPAYDLDNKVDAEIVKALRHDTVDLENESVNELIEEAESLKEKIDLAKDGLKELEDRYKAILDAFKSECKSRMKDDVDTVDIVGKRYIFTLSRGSKTEINTAAMKKDGVYEKYAGSKETYTMRVKENKEN